VSRGGSSLCSLFNFLAFVVPGVVIGKPRPVQWVVDADALALKLSRELAI